MSDKFFLEKQFELHEHFAPERRDDRSSEMHTVGLSGSLKRWTIVQKKKKKMFAGH